MNITRFSKKGKKNSRIRLVKRILAIVSEKFVKIILIQDECGI